jgi:3-oxoacyl-[acyl-carrier-protein] synthase-1
MQPCFGNGLTDAFRNALIPSAADEINHIITTLNGEGIHAKELGVAMTRNQAKMAPDVAVHHPADCFGDIGAAFTTVLLGTTAFNLEQGAVSGNCLIYGSSDTEYRGAVVLQG